MATVTKTFSFVADTEGLSDGGNSNRIGFEYVPMGVNTDNGCIQFRTLLSIAGLATEFARRPTTGETWETWGVPRNSTVESVRIQGYQDRTVLATMLLSHTIKMRVIGSDGLVVHSGSTNLVNDTLANTVHMSWDQSTEGIFLQLMQTDKTQQRMCVWN